MPTELTREELAEWHEARAKDQEGVRQGLLRRGSEMAETYGDSISFHRSAAELLRAPAGGEDIDDELGFDPYDETAQRVMSWTLARVAGVLGVAKWEGGDGTESVEGDVDVEVCNILQAGGLVTPDGDILTAERFASLPVEPTPPAAPATAAEPSDEGRVRWIVEGATDHAYEVAADALTVNPESVSDIEAVGRWLKSAVAALGTTTPAPADAAKVLAYEHAHEAAVSLGYPSLTEALEALDNRAPAGGEERGLKEPQPDHVKAAARVLLGNRHGPGYAAKAEKGEHPNDWRNALRDAHAILALVPPASLPAEPTDAVVEAAFAPRPEGRHPDDWLARTSDISDVVQRVLLRRSYDNTLDGHIGPVSVEVAEAVRAALAALRQDSAS